MRKARRRARRRAHFFWVAKLVAPWRLAAGLLFCFTAQAGQEVPSGSSLALQTSQAAVMPRQLAAQPALIAGSLLAASGRGLLHDASLALGAPEEIAAPAYEAAPRAVMKGWPNVFPRVNRRDRGDPSVGAPLSLQGRLLQKNGLARMRAELLTYQRDRSGLASSFTREQGDVPGPDSVASFNAWPQGETPMAVPGPDGASPSQGLAAVTMRPAAVVARLEQGASPVVLRAAVLDSATPAEADQTPVAVFPGMASTSGGATDGRDYLAMIRPGRLSAEKRCLAEAVYFEARSEPENGQAAVAQVVLNRVTSGLYPSTICGVVFQNRSHYNACQFSFACDGKPLRINEPDAWSEAKRIADNVLAGKTWVRKVGDATYYHADYVRPRWARTMKKMDVIGRHIFYRLKSNDS